MKKILIKILLPVVFWLGVWFILAKIIDSPLALPGPVQVFTRLITLFGERSFYVKTGASLLRVLGGMAAGTLLGMLLAFITESSKVLQWILAPAIRIIRTVPVASFIILVLLWVSKGKVPGVISGLIVLPMIWESTSMGLREAPRILLEMAEHYEMSKVRIWRYVRIPALIPHLMTGLSNGIGLAWKSGVAAEVLCVPAMAIGTEVYQSKIYLETADLFAWTLVVVVLSMIIERAICRAMERGVKRWN